MKVLLYIKINNTNKVYGFKSLSSSASTNFIRCLATRVESFAKNYVSGKMFRYHPTFKFIQLHKKLSGERVEMAIF